MCHRKTQSGDFNKVNFVPAADTNGTESVEIGSRKGHGKGTQLMAVSNFEFLKEYDPVFFQLANNAELIFAIDPNASLMKVRQLGEALAKDIAARIGLTRGERETQLQLLNRISNRLQIDAQIVSLFHALRKEGNDASHEYITNHRQAMEGLRSARQVAIWYHRAFGKEGDSFKPGPFVLPPDPSEKLRSLQVEIEQLKANLSDANESTEKSEELAALKKREADEYAELAQHMEEQSREFEELFYEQEKELEQSKADFEKRVAAQSDEIERLKKENEGLQQVRRFTRKASAKLALNEDETRILIDQSLIAAGWEADSAELTYSKGARPEKGKNRAIAKWPCKHQYEADYVLFSGLTPVGIVEAKRENTDVAAKLPQAERYSGAFAMQKNMEPAWEREGRTVAWPKGDEDHYYIPFVYSSNGRPYVKQYREKSGIWFRDARKPSNIPKPLPEFHSPEGLLDRLTRNKEEAEALLKEEGFAYLGVRDYQQKAIQAVEQALENGSTEVLLAMATGTGKTRTIIGLIYRFLKTERFKRILFLVDRTALGSQAEDAFKEVELEQSQTLWTAYNVTELGDKAVEDETRVQVATVQAMVQRVFQSDSKPSVDTYDCIIIDEAHRGYTLDQEMTEGEAEVRDASQYLSSYRRVLDYFDAFKVGMTATPAMHTTQIFGKPIYTYSYREAVADDWLIDHEPPKNYETRLNKNGIHLEKGETVSVVNTETGEVDLAELEDEMSFDVESFNRQVITPDFNRVIAEAFAEEFDPAGDEKAMVFCVNQAHAELFKGKLEEAFRDLYEDSYNQDAVKVITGQTDQVGKAIKRYKNERYPTVAITVDLLTTGIDVKPICHLLVIRRVKSRVLYEQMIGRATRLCPEIGKTEFIIHDAVGIYESLEQVTSMKPLVKDPNITIQQLVEELHDPASQDAPGATEETSHAHDVLDQLSQKIMRILRKAAKKAETNDKVKSKLGEMEQAWGVEPAQLHKHLHQLGPQQAKDFLIQHHQLLFQLEAIRNLIGSEERPVIYEGQDELLKINQGYGIAEKPADYLEGFSDFIKGQLNESTAIQVVCRRPRDLTREQLKDIRLLLDSKGFTEASLKAAWRSQTNQDIAASIVGHIRQAALGEALVPFERRVELAMDRIYEMHPWTKVQRTWLNRLAKQLSHEVVMDQNFVNRVFASAGGAKRLDKHLGGQLESILNNLKAGLWEAS